MNDQRKIRELQRNIRELQEDVSELRNRLASMEAARRYDEDRFISYAEDVFGRLDNIGRRVVSLEDAREAAEQRERVQADLQRRHEERLSETDDLG